MMNVYEGIVKRDELHTYAHMICEYAHVQAQLTTRACIIAFEGDLGAGKTTLIQHIARQLGIADVLQSPTFVVMKRYPIPQHIHVYPTAFTQLIHIDAYRIQSNEEANVLGLHALLHERGVLLCIEWPSHIPSLIPHIRIQLAHAENQDSEERRLTISTA